MRGHESPLSGFFHPNVSEAVVVVVGSLAVDALLVVNAGHNGRFAVHPNLHLGDLGNFDVRGSARAVAEISGLAIGAPVFESDDEVLVQDSRKYLYLPMLVAIEHLQFEGPNL